MSLNLDYNISQNARKPSCSTNLKGSSFIIIMRISAFLQASWSNFQEIKVSLPSTFSNDNKFCPFDSPLKGDFGQLCICFLRELVPQLLLHPNSFLQNLQMHRSAFYPLSFGIFVKQSHTLEVVLWGFFLLDIHSVPMEDTLATSFVSSFEALFGVELSNGSMCNQCIIYRRKKDNKNSLSVEVKQLQMCTINYKEKYQIVM
jgi:hypothetical protein